MTDILCRWLNEDVCLEPKLAKSLFTEQFSNGYLFGEVLYKHGLQPDFIQFSQGKSSEAKLNNFLRLEPTFKLLEIPFNINMARDIMTKKAGVATRLMYQLFVALNRIKDSQVVGQSLESMRPFGKVKLEKIETGIFQKRLKQRTPRQADLNFEGLIHKFQERQKSFEETRARERQREEERIQLERKQLCHKSLENSRVVRERQAQLYAKLKPLSPSKPSPRTPGERSRTAGSLSSEKSRSHRQAEANATRDSIDAFEATLGQRTAPPTIGGEPRPFSTGSLEEQSRLRNEAGMTVGPSADYVRQIRKRVQDNDQARKEREKRRRKVLVEQMQALQEQENMRREKMLVERLMRQCQQERRIATQLMAIRKEKDTIRNNRIYRLQQYEEQRMREFNEAMDRERELAKCEEQSRMDQVKQHKELYRQYRALKADSHYQSNYRLCHEVLLQIVDFASKMAEYRVLTKDLIPSKMVCDWKTLFVAGRPLYEGDDQCKAVSVTSMSSTARNKSSSQLLDDADFQEYKTAVCEWVPPDHLANELPRLPNILVAHLVYRTLDMLDPPQPPAAPPSFPRFLLRASFIGKPFSGKTTILKRLEKACGRLAILSLEVLVTKAVSVYLSEKRLIQNQLSMATTEGEDPVTTEDNEVPRQDTCTPGISIDPSSSVNIIMSSVDTPTPNDGPPELTEGRGSEEALTDELLSQLSPLAQLGHKAHVAMMDGESLDDEAIIDIFAYEMRTLPDDSSFILDNFPTTLEQAMLLAKALAGAPTLTTTVSRNFELLMKRPDHKRVQGAASGLDLLVHFDVTTDNVLLRASHEAAGNSNKLDDVQLRLSAFDEHWPPMKRWYHKFKILEHIDANNNFESVYSLVQDKIKEIVKHAEATETIRKLKFELGKTPSPSPMNSTHTLTSESATSFSSGILKNGKMSKKSSVKGTPRASSAGTPGTPLQPATPSNEDASSSNGRALSSSSGPIPSTQSKGRFTPSTSGKILPAENTSAIIVNPYAKPGDPGAVFIHMPLDMELGVSLAEKWPNLEETYVNTLKSVFLSLRGEREEICRYFYEKSTEYTTYLCRPDAKQEFVSQWQTAYNSIAPHLRREDAMKAELHHRVADLSEKLWDISDHRREQAEQEKQRILSDNWLEDHTGLITNHYIALLQAELDRFYDTCLLLKDYYDGMEEKVPAKIPDPGRLPYVELAPTDAPELPSSTTNSMQNVLQPPPGEPNQLNTGDTPTSSSSSTTDTPKREPSLKRTPSLKKAPSLKTVVVKKRVPVLPRQPPPEQTEDKAPKKKGGGAAASTPPPPVEDIGGLELDQQLVVHAYNLATSFVFSSLVHKIKDLDDIIAELSKPPSTKSPEHQPVVIETKEEKGKKGKKEKAKSPAGKKGKASPGKPGKGAPPPPEPIPEAPAAAPATLSPEDQVKRERILILHKEHKDALQLEETGFKLRADLIKGKCLEKLEDIKTKSETLSTEMTQWLGDSYKQEVECVNNLTDVLRQAVENEEKLLYEITLPGTVLNIKQSVLTFLPSPPPSPPPQVEPSHPSHFTVTQLLNLHQQLYSLAPSGFMVATSLVDTLKSFVERTVDGNTLPDSWGSMTREQLQRVCDLVYGPDVDCIDWRRFLVCVAQPWPIPSSNQLLEALSKYESLVPTRAGRVSKEQYMEARVWFDEVEDDRSVRIKDAFYDLFSDDGGLDYKAMLLYLCVDSLASEGLKKALSLTLGQVVTMDIGSEVTICLEELHKVLAHGSYHGDSQTATSALTMSDLFDLFLSLSPANPNEVSVSVLMSHDTIWNYLTSTSNYHLTDISGITRPDSRQTETD